MRMIAHVVSVSGGKDSTVTADIAIRRVGKENCRFVFCDTGNEHQAVYDYLDYLEGRLGVRIERLRANFSAQVLAKRRFVANDRRVGRAGGRKLRWTNRAKRRALQVFAYHREHGIEPNPLYRMGMTRVGCMPCVNVNKAELRQIGARFPEVINRIARWEDLVGLACKGGYATMLTGYPSSKGNRKIHKEVFADLNIAARLRWAKTARGGRQYDLLAVLAPPSCASAYGLCE